MDTRHMDKVFRYIYGYMLGLGIVFMFLGTVGMIDKCMVSYGDIININEVSYNECFAQIKYTDHADKTYTTILPIDCPSKEDYGRVVVLRYSPWNSMHVNIGHPWITCQDALTLYKFGMFISFVSLPYYVYLYVSSRYNRKDDVVVV